MAIPAMTHSNTDGMVGIIRWDTVASVWVSDDTPDVAKITLKSGAGIHNKVGRELALKYVKLFAEYLSEA